MKKSLILMIVLFSGALIFTSCDDNIPIEDNPDYFINLVTEAVGPTLADQTINAVDEFIDIYYTDSSTTLPVDGLNLVLKTGIQQVVEFGKGGYLDFNGRTITGTVFVTKTDSQSWSYLFKDVTINGNSVRSIRNVTRISEKIIEINSLDTVILLSGERIYRSWNRTRELNCESSLCTPICRNCYTLSGEVNCENSTGDIFHVKILEPLNVKEGYKYFTSGVIETKTSKGTQILDFGDGEKDNLVTSTINGKTQVLRLNW